MPGMKWFGDIRWTKCEFLGDFPHIRSYVPEFDYDLFRFAFIQRFFRYFRPSRMLSPIIKIPLISLWIVILRRTSRLYKIMKSSLQQHQISFDRVWERRNCTERKVGRWTGTRNPPSLSKTAFWSVSSMDWKRKIEINDRFDCASYQSSIFCIFLRFKITFD